MAATDFGYILRYQYQAMVPLESLTPRLNFYGRKTDFDTVIHTFFHSSDPRGPGGGCTLSSLPVHFVDGQTCQINTLPSTLVDGRTDNSSKSLARRRRTDNSAKSLALEDGQTIIMPNHWHARRRTDNLPKMTAATATDGRSKLLLTAPNNYLTMADSGAATPTHHDAISLDIHILSLLLHSNNYQHRRCIYYCRLSMVVAVLKQSLPCISIRMS